MKKLWVFLLGLVVLFALQMSDALAFDNNKERVEKYIQEQGGIKELPWYGQNVYISKETFFYSDDDNIPSYIEYKISCKDEKNCGFVILNLDGTDASVPFASFWGETLSEQMGATAESKNYYFGIFEHFSISPKGKITSTSPENQYSLSERDLSQNQSLGNLGQQALLKKIKRLQQVERENKFKNREIQNDIKKNSFRGSGIESEIYSRNSSHFLPGSFVSGQCNSRTPCYHQAMITYPSSRIDSNVVGNTGPSGCTPTAFSIVLGYYDNNGFQNIIRNSNAPSTNSAVIRNLQTILGDYMNTRLVSSAHGNQGSTYTSNNPEGWRYLNGKYAYSSDYNNWLWYFDVLSKIQGEINSNRPILIGYDGNGGGGHTIVAHGYNGNTLYVNFGWGVSTANSTITLDGKNFVGDTDSGTVDRLDTLVINN